MSSFFKKPSWAKAAAPQPSGDFFRRSEHIFGDIIASQKARGNSDSESDSKPNIKAEKSRSRKRRRVSVEDDSNGDGSREVSPQGDGISKFTDNPSRESPAPAQEPPKQPQRPPSKRAPTLSRSPSRLRDTPSNIVSLDSSPEPVVASSIEPKNPEPTLVVSSDDDLESEEEFPELARKAREKARWLKETSKEPTPTITAPSARVAQYETTSNKSPQERPSPKKRPSEKAPDEPIAHIYITSELEDTKPLLVQRRLIQGLGDVRKTWCKRQGFSNEMTRTIILTWNGIRLFDVTTCKSLGIDASKFDDPFANDQSNEDKVLRVHMEAITKALYDAKRKQAEHKAGEEENETGEPAKPPEKLLRLNFRSANREDMLRFKVKASSTVAMVIESVRRGWKIPPEKTIELHFDGDRLDPLTTTQDTELDDLDCVDVLIK